MGLLSSLPQGECRMPQTRRAVKLTKAERGALETFVADGKRSARVITRARILLLSDEGQKEGSRGDFSLSIGARALWGHRSFLT